jgi:hypothetical protein
VRHDWKSNGVGGEQCANCNMWMRWPKPSDDCPGRPASAAREWQGRKPEYDRSKECGCVTLSCPHTPDPFHLASTAIPVTQPVKSHPSDSEPVERLADLINEPGFHWFGVEGLCVKCVRPPDEVALCLGTKLIRSAALREARIGMQTKKREPEPERFGRASWDHPISFTPRLGLRTP